MIIADAQDEIYPHQGYSRLRSSVRGLVFDGDKCAFMHILTHDEFGARDHFEIPGGGIEKGEDHSEALKRELLEEVGAHVSVGKYLGLYIERLNTIKRISFHHYYICHLKSLGQNQLTDYEKEVIEGIEWHTPLEWLEILSKPLEGVNHLIHQRELTILKSFI